LSRSDISWFKGWFFLCASILALWFLRMHHLGWRLAILVGILT
jgi:hypothetical protein